MPDAGLYTFELVSLENGDGGHTHVLWKIVDLDERAAQSHEVGDLVSGLFMFGGKSTFVSQGKVKAMCMAFAGYDDEDEFDAFDNGASGQYIDACYGDQSPFLEDGASPIIGAQAICQVTLGKEVPSKPGERFREYSWGALES